MEDRGQKNFKVSDLSNTRMELPVIDMGQTEFREEGQAGDINLGILSIQRVPKAKRLHEITREKSVDLWLSDVEKWDSWARTCNRDMHEE